MPLIPCPGLRPFPGARGVPGVQVSLNERSLPVGTTGGLGCETDRQDGLDR